MWVLTAKGYRANYFTWQVCTSVFFTMMSQPLLQGTTARYTMWDDGENIYCPRCECSMGHTKKCQHRLWISGFNLSSHSLSGGKKQRKKERSSNTHYTHCYTEHQLCLIKLRINTEQSLTWDIWLVFRLSLWHDWTGETISTSESQ